MIIINRDIQLTILVLPTIPYEYQNVRLRLHSDFTNKDFVIPLLDDVAIHPQRYSEFEIQSQYYSAIETGLYQYAILADDDIISIGMCRIKSNEPTIDYTSIAPVEDDDYIVFR